jgi:hypothetical protein
LKINCRWGDTTGRANSIERRIVLKPSKAIEALIYDERRKTCQFQQYQQVARLK